LRAASPQQTSFFSAIRSSSQPQKASHPDGAELSALEHLLEGHDTERGLFLGETWRLHRALCTFTSEMFYEGKLRPHAGLAAQELSGATPFAGAGLFYVPVRHHGNQNASAEEANRIAELVADLTRAGVSWTNRHGETRQVALTDIVIVAPYNAQVATIASRVAGARVGTVDKFQGPGGANRRLLDGYLDPRRGAPRDGVPVQPESSKRGYLSRAVRMHPRRKPRTFRT
jgi:superfamily I DNA and/or RNA helicase